MRLQLASPLGVAAGRATEVLNNAVRILTDLHDNVSRLSMRINVIVMNEVTIHSNSPKIGYRFWNEFFFSDFLFLLLYFLFSFSVLLPPPDKNNHRSPLESRERKLERVDKDPNQTPNLATIYDLSPSPHALRFKTNPVESPQTMSMPEAQQQQQQ